MRLALAVAAALFATPSQATDPSFTMGFADLIAAEALCGLTYDQSAIENAIAANVDASDVGFTPQLKGLVFVAEQTQADMSTSAKTAHCAQIRSLAKTYGLTD